MGSGHCHRGLVIAHQLSQELCPGKHGDAPLLRGSVFGIVRMDGGSVDNHLAVLRNIGRFLADEDLSPQGRKMIRESRSVAVRARHRKAFFQKNLGEAAHTDAADADEMNGNGSMKMKLIHRFALPVRRYFTLPYKKGCPICGRHIQYSINI